MSPCKNASKGGHIVSRNYRMPIYRTFQHIKKKSYQTSNIEYLDIDLFCVFAAENSPKIPKILRKSGNSDNSENFRKFSEISENSPKFQKIRRNFWKFAKNSERRSFLSPQYRIISNKKAKYRIESKKTYHSLVVGLSENVKMKLLKLVTFFLL